MDINSHPRVLPYNAEKVTSENEDRGALETRLQYVYTIRYSDRRNPDGGWTLNSSLRSLGKNDDCQHVPVFKDVFVHSDRSHGKVVYEAHDKIRKEITRALQGKGTWTIVAECGDGDELRLSPGRGDNDTLTHIIGKANSVLRQLLPSRVPSMQKVQVPFRDKKKEFSVLEDIKDALLRSKSDKKVKGKSRYTVSLPVKELKVFRLLQKSNYEVGGFLDFNKRRSLDRFITWFGTRYAVDFPTLDYEVDWHVHPTYNDGRVFNPPSGGDYMSLALNYMEFGTQASIVFTDDGVYVFWPSDDLMLDLKAFTDDELDDYLDYIETEVQVEFDHANSTGDRRSYYELIETLGWKIKLVPYDSDIKLDVFVVE